VDLGLLRLGNDTVAPVEPGNPMSVSENGARGG
jgi:hypothetical protein